MLNARPVRGLWRRLRSGANIALIALLFAVPWIRIGGEPLVLLDVPARKFHVLGLVIFPQELYFLWLLVAGLALSLFFFTALAGRLWCGWACPQTVFTDLFAGIARRIQGWHGARAPRHVAAWRRALTHGVWLVISALVAFHLVAYFRSPYTWIADLRGGAPPTTAGGFLLAFTLLAYVDLAFVRQTFCKYLCPYARFQGVLFDRDTLVIGYDARRGEPRGKRGTVAGDCVDCGLCVEVCPSEIDIRNGLQLECIACTQCIDACNGVMQRIGRPRNLIAYRSLASLEQGRPPRWMRPRVVAYGALLGCIVVVFAASLARRQPMELTVERNRSSLYSLTAGGEVSNAYTLHIENRARVDRRFHLRLEEAPYELVAGMNPIEIPATAILETRVFVIAHGDRSDVAHPGASREIHFVLEPEDDSAQRVVRRTRFFAPSGGEAHGG